MTSNSSTFPDGRADGSSAMGSLSLAFIGDAVYELLVRDLVLSRGDAKAATLHASAVRLSNADFQAEAGERLLPCLTEAERDVYRRGKNAHSAHTPKNKSAYAYSRATALEAVFGKLYLDGDSARIRELFDIIVKMTEANP